MLVMWVVILRVVSIEFRSQIDDPLWRSFWDGGLWLGSTLIAFLLGAALGNVLRGLPLGADGYFQGAFALLLNPYSLLTGVLSLPVLAWHGANYLRLKTEGSLQQRAHAWSNGLWWGVAAFGWVSSAMPVPVAPAIAASTTPAPL